MSYELLVLAGGPHRSDQVRRSALINHAAENVPGAVSCHVEATAHAVAALVETTPSGGTSGKVTVSADGVRIAVATSRSGLEASAPGGAGRAAGSEAGHVVALLKADGDLVVATDGISFVPAYWGEVGSDIALSTHLASLVSLGLPADPDTTGVIEYLAMQHCLQARTLLGGASVLPAGAHLERRSGRPVLLRAAPIYVPSESTRSDDEFVAEFRDVWTQVIAGTLARASGERAALGLSGGLDSRAIACEATAQGVHLLSYTYGAPPSREAMVAAEVAHRLQLPHLGIPVTDDRLLKGAVNTARLLDGAHSPTEMYELWFTDVLRGFADVIINGHAGGPVWGDEKALGVFDLDVAAERVSRRYGGMASAVQPFAERSLRHEFDVQLRESIRDSMAPWDIGTRGDAVTFWGMANRQQRWGNMLVTALRRAGLRMEAPFLDSRFVEINRCMTYQQRKNGRLYLRLHREVFARTADIRRSDDGNRPRNLDHVYWSGDVPMLQQLAGLARRHPVSAGRRASRRVIGVAASSVRQRTRVSLPADEWDRRGAVFAPEVWLRRRPVFAVRMAELLEAGVGSSPLLDDDVVATAAARLRDGQSAGSAAALGRVAAIGVWAADHRSRQQEARDVLRRLPAAREVMPCDVRDERPDRTGGP